jgi:hypothetical protein
MLISTKRTRSLAVIACLCLGLLATAANAQKSVRLHATPASFQAFYAKFKKAVIGRDKTAVASLTAFPFQWGFDAGDEGTWTRSQFVRNFSKIFDGKPSILSRKDPTFYVDRGDYSLTDERDASHLSFTRTGRSYKFTSYIVEP